MRKQLLNAVEIILLLWVVPWWPFCLLVPVAIALIWLGYFVVGYWVGVVFLLWGLAALGLWVVAVLLGHCEAGL